MTWRLDPVDGDNVSRDFTLDEISALMRHFYRKIQTPQHTAFIALFPDMAPLFQDNMDE